MNELETKLMSRLLTAEEIEVRIAQVNENGARILLYKDARTDQNILDEIFGPLGWQNRYYTVSGKLHCVISVWDNEKQQWIEKDNRGVASGPDKEKGEASDAFKRAGFNLGIGRELYTVRGLFVPKDKLQGYVAPDENTPGQCLDTITVKDIKSEIVGSEKRIQYITLEIAYGGKVHDTVKFGRVLEQAEISATTRTKTAETTEAAEAPAASMTQSSQSTPVQAVSEAVKPKAEAKAEAAPAAPMAETAKTTPAAEAVPTDEAIFTKEFQNVPEKSAQNVQAEGLRDDDVILISFSGVKNKRYGDVKNTESFKKLLKWAKKTDTTYSDNNKMRQLLILKQMSS